MTRESSFTLDLSYPTEFPMEPGTLMEFVWEPCLAQRELQYAL